MGVSPIRWSRPSLGRDRFPARLAETGFSGQQKLFRINELAATGRRCCQGPGEPGRRISFVHVLASPADRPKCSLALSGGECQKPPVHCPHPTSVLQERRMFKPLHDRVLVRRMEQANKTAGGIIIPDTAKEKPMEGE